MGEEKNSILLMSLRSPYLDDEKIYAPLGLLYLKSAVDKELPEFKVDLADEYDLSDLSKFEKYEYIGLSIMTPQRQEALNVLNAIKSKYPNKKIIAGGPHVLHYMNEVKKAGFDYLVPRDGQRSLVKILKGEADAVEFDSMDPGEWARQPRPDRTSKEAKEFLSTYHYKLNGKNAGTMLTATGCPMTCSFCEDAGTAVRWSPLDKLIQEMDDLVNLNYDGVYLFDDLFAININKVKPIAKELQKRNLIYRCNGQANFFTKWGEDFAKLLSETGCYEIAFGHESGSQKILDNINKKTKVEQNYKSIEYAKKHGIKVKSFVMLGLPGENLDTIKETEEFLKNGGMDDFQLAIYFPYRGTKIRDSIDMGINGMDLFVEAEGLGAYGQKGGSTESTIRTKALSSEQLLKIRDELVKKYKPESHLNKWKNDKFYDTQLNSNVEYPEC